MAIGQAQEDNYALKRWEAAKEDLDTALAMHDEVLQELQEKNKLVDELQFKLKDVSHAAGRVRVLEEELEALQGKELELSRLVSTMCVGVGVCVWGGAWACACVAWARRSACRRSGGCFG